MQAVLAAPWRERRVGHPGCLLAGLALVAAALSLRNAAGLLPLAEWPAFSGLAAAGDMRAMLVAYGFLPRLAICLAAGAALGLAGTLLQQVLRNPLAEPTTLGISAGAQLALTAATLFGPSWLASGRGAVTLAGAGAAMALVLGLSWRAALAPLTLVLAGLIVTFYAGSLAALLGILHHDYLQSVFIWGAGSLVQNGWTEVLHLVPRLTAAWLLAVLLVRPLGLLDLDEASARGLGVPVRTVRLLAIAAAVVAAAAVVGAVGIVGFVGLAAPALVRAAGAHRFRTRLVWAPLAGAVLLWLTDQLVQTMAGSEDGLLPTGAVTAVVGAPLLLWLMRGMHPREPAPPDVAGSGAVRPWKRIWIVGGIAGGAVAMALLLGAGPHGWHLGDGLAAALPWRMPRVAAALAAGALLAQAGTILQRLTGNPLASPEVLGLSAGATVGAILLHYMLAEPGRAAVTLAATAGAAASLAAILLLARRAAFAGERMLMVGIAVGTAMSALTAVVLATGDPRLAGLLTWLAGSTYAVTGGEAGLAGGLAAVLLLATLLAARWLTILPLGAVTAQALGLRLPRVRLLLLLLAAAQTAAATLLVGPMSFVGLLAPHAARMLGLRRTAPQLVGATLLGMLVMVAGDWLGRNLIFPYQIPAGLMASLVGGIYLMLLLLRR